MATIQPVRGSTRAVRWAVLAPRQALVDGDLLESRRGLGELVRVHDARFFLSKATIQTRQDCRLDSLSPEHVMRNPVPYQLLGQHAISVKCADCGSKLLPVQVRADRHREFFNTTNLERVDDLDCRNHHAILLDA